MKILKCSDIGIKCGYAEIGATAEDVKRKLLAHAAKVHAGMLERMSIEDRAALERKIEGMLE